MFNNGLAHLERKLKTIKGNARDANSALGDLDSETDDVRTVAHVPGFFRSSAVCTVGAGNKASDSIIPARYVADLFSPVPRRMWLPGIVRSAQPHRGAASTRFGRVTVPHGAEFYNEGYKNDLRVFRFILVIRFGVDCIMSHF